jgi:hypothetical protein
MYTLSKWVKCFFFMCCSLYSVYIGDFVGDYVVDYGQYALAIGFNLSWSNVWGWCELHKLRYYWSVFFFKSYFKGKT